MDLEKEVKEGFLEAVTPSSILKDEEVVSRLIKREGRSM